MFRPDSRFLVIDDAKIIRELVRSSLIQIGMQYIDEAVDGPSGYQKIKDAAKEGNPYSLVFCDVNMPGFDGLKLLELVRSEPQIADTPIVIITTESSKQTVIRAVMEGISGYIVKPFGPDEIHLKIMEIFKSTGRKEKTSQT